MADKYSNILKPLQEHELMPPAGAFDKAWENILLQKEGAVHSEAGYKNVFEKLQAYSMQAPELDFKSVITGEKKTTQKKQAPVISKNLMRVAAVLALAVTSTVIYLAMPKKDKADKGNGQYAGVQKSKNQKNKEADDNVLIGSAQDTTALTGAAKQLVFNGNAGITVKNTKKDARIPYREQAGFYNNDLFFTLVNYKEYGKEKLFAKTIKDKRVTLNQYSYVNLSDKMVAMLQEVYLTKKNGKIARKAKRAKKKFEKWKKKEEKYFDKNLDKNPADIIDLGEFLMNN